MSRTAAGGTLGLHALPRADELLPWRAVNVSVYPFGGRSNWWPFNPSIHRDPASGVWRCLVRLANYTLPGGVPHLAPEARAGRARTRNILLTLDDATLRPVGLAEVGEPRDDLPRSPTCNSLGLEDLRLFRTASDGLCAVGCALQYNLTHPSRPEIVICRFGEGDGRPTTTGPEGVPLVPLARVATLRGAWNFRAQKNWVPFDDTVDIRLLYSIERGILMAEAGHVGGTPPPVTERQTTPSRPQVMRPGRNGAEVRLFGKPTATRQPKDPPGPTRQHDELRGGSQLMALSDGRWIGVGHEMTFSHARWAKFYWHTFYTLDDSGRLLEQSRPLRLSGDHGIEFAAGLAIDESADRLVVSYGTDDHEAWVADTRLSGILDLLQPVTRPAIIP